MPSIRPALLSMLALVLMVMLAACSGGPTFDPVGSYSGTVYPGGTPASITAGITATSSSGSWDFSAFVPSTGASLVGTCTHDTSLGANDLSCNYLDNGTGHGTMVGDLVTNTWSGTISEGSDTGTFVLTR